MVQKSAASVAPTGSWARPLSTTVQTPAKSTTTSIKDETQNKKEETKPKQETTQVRVVSEAEQQSSFAFSKNKVIVVDTGAIVYKAVQLERFGSEFVTTSQVIGEIRDSRSKYILNTLPFQLKLREPQKESIQFISEYAKRTGDYGNLSSCDLGILALTYEIENELNGNTNIKPLPKELPISGHRKVILRPFSDLYKKNDEDTKEEASQEGDDARNDQEEDDQDWGGEHEVTSLNDDYDYETIKDKIKNQRNNANDNQEQDEQQESDDYDSDDDDDDDGWITLENISDHKKKIIGSGKANAEKWHSEEQSQNNNKQEEQQQPLEEEEEQQQEGEEVEEGEEAKEEEEESDDEEHDQIKKEESEEEGRARHSLKEVGCITVDYSMQNVLLHMGLNLVSIDGRRIKYLTRYVKRCYACYTLVPDNSRIFCTNCGVDALLRCTCIVDAKTGEAGFYYNPRKVINKRGFKFPLPLPKGGRNNKDPITREDQLARFRKGMPRKKDQVLNKRPQNGGGDDGGLWQPEYSYDSAFQAITRLPKGRYHLGRNTLFNGYGRKNPNVAVKRTGKKKKSNRPV
ncbi:20S-pre-rRNA D-site endonuclease nob1 [Acrasis kona]|uniref:20S-pre-rRNA D-site endonuclease nob1 n=1 Tax=Acrasis kona TaxID=1008807 RepID=A0AAW2YWR6_9EUKA